MRGKIIKFEIRNKFGLVENRRLEFNEYLNTFSLLGTIPSGYEVFFTPEMCESIKGILESVKN
jgi:hypothetical protein